MTFINTDNWLLISLSDAEPNSEPINGMSFRIGTLVWLIIFSCIWQLLVMMSLATDTAWMFRLAVLFAVIHLYFDVLGRITSIRDLSRNQNGDVLTNSDITLLTVSNKQICIAKLERMIDW